MKKQKGDYIILNIFVPKKNIPYFETFEKLVKEINNSAERRGEISKRNQKTIMSPAINYLVKRWVEVQLNKKQRQNNDTSD